MKQYVLAALLSSASAYHDKSELAQTELKAGGLTSDAVVDEVVDFYKGTDDQFFDM